MSKLTNDKKRALGEQMFIENMRTSKYIAEYLEVSGRTVGRWREKYNWDKRRTEALASPHRIKNILFRELETLAEGGDKSIEADGLYKIFKVIEGLSDRTSVQVVLSVFKEFDNWMIDQDTDMAINFLDYHKKFVLFKAEQQ